jgi:hypothetical protein
VNSLLQAARGLRYARGVVTEGLRWGNAMGRMRWIVAFHPTAARSSLATVINPTTSPPTGWGFDELARKGRQEDLARELESVAPSDRASWLVRAFDAFDTPALARLLGARAIDVATIELPADASRRARGRWRKLVDGSAPGSASLTPGMVRIDRPDAEPDPEREPTSDSFRTVRRALHARLPGKRALFISNREDVELKDKVAAAFGLDVTWCVASTRRVEAAADAIRGGRYDVVLSATGFQDHAMDGALSRAAKDSPTLFVRVNRGRVAACARAIARELGLDTDSDTPARKHA